MLKSPIKEIVLSTLLVLVVYYLINCIPRYVKSNIDNRYYLVSNTSDKQQVADTLAQLNKNADILFEYLRRVYSNDQLRFYKNSQLLLSKFDPNLLGENFLRLGTSFTINKGSFIAMCVKNNDAVHDINTLMYVLIHELAHVGTESQGHTKEFIDFFKFLLDSAIELEIYTYVDYSKTQGVYCGMKLHI